MKQFDKTPFFKKGDGVFCFGLHDKMDKPLGLSQKQTGNEEMISCFRTHVPVYVFTDRALKAVLARLGI